MLNDVDIAPIAIERLAAVIGPERTDRFRSTAARSRALLDGRRVLNVNSTASGGGVAELLQTLLAYTRGAGIDARWTVIQGNPKFFQITKRIHNHLYGHVGDGGPLDLAEHRVYEATLATNLDELRGKVRRNDVIVLHDPQTAGLLEPLKHAGAIAVWRCHVGIDTQNEHSTRGWDFLRRYIQSADAFVFSRAQFAPPWIPSERLHVIAPSIDPFSAKNEDLSHADVIGRLITVGLLQGDGTAAGGTYSRRDGTASGHAYRPLNLVDTSAIPLGVPVVMQASRWDAMKDMPGVLHAFAEHLPAMGSAHLLLTGPETAGVTDDPESDLVLRQCIDAYNALGAEARERIHLACVPMQDPDEAAAIVNAMQRYATVIAQKSLAEGFGLTVAEAMWKSRPVVASNVGGIADQIVPPHTGLLIDDPQDLDHFANAVASLLADPQTAHHMGERARERAVDLFLGDRHLEQWSALLQRLDLATR